MALVLAIEPDARQGAILKRVVRERAHAEIAVVDSKDAAIAAIAAHMPDLILVTALLSPRDEEDLVAHLRSLEEADHLQTITIPLLATAGATDEEGGGFFKAFRKKKQASGGVGCDPWAFGEQVIGYLRAASDTRAARLARKEYERTHADAQPFGEAAQDASPLADQAGHRGDVREHHATPEAGAPKAPDHLATGEPINDPDYAFTWRSSTKPETREKEPRRGAKPPRAAEPPRVVEPPPAVEPPRATQPPRAAGPELIIQPAPAAEPPVVITPARRAEPELPSGPAQTAEAELIVEPPRAPEPPLVLEPPHAMEPAVVVPVPPAVEPVRASEPAPTAAARAESEPSLVVESPLAAAPEPAADPLILPELEAVLGAAGEASSGARGQVPEVRGAEGRGLESEAQGLESAEAAKTAVPPPQAAAPAPPSKAVTPPPPKVAAPPSPKVAAPAQAPPKVAPPKAPPPRPQKPAKAAKPPKPPAPVALRPLKRLPPLAMWARIDDPIPTWPVPASIGPRHDEDDVAALMASLRVPPHVLAVSYPRRPSIRRVRSAA